MFVKISVVTVCFNCREDLLRTIDSVVSQTYCNIEYIIIDGGSTDGTVEVIKSNAEKISCWISEHDNGIYDAMNKGIALATGEWIIFMNAGDTFYDNRVISNIFSKKFEKEVAIIYGDTEFDLGFDRKFIRRLKQHTQQDVIGDLNHQSMLTRTSILKTIGGFDTYYKICADFKSFVEIDRLGKKFEYVPIIIAIFECSEGISSIHPLQLLIEKKKILGYSYLSIRFIKGCIKALMRFSLSKIVSKKQYAGLMYNKVKRISKYQ